MNCISCHAAELEERTTKMPAKVKGEALMVPRIRALVCPNCGYKTVKGSTMPEYMRLAADVYRANHGLLTSDEIRARRKALGMNQVEFAAHLGSVGVASVKRWELGQVQDRAMDKLIRVTTDANEAKTNY